MEVSAAFITFRMEIGIRIVKYSFDFPGKDNRRREFLFLSTKRKYAFDSLLLFLFGWLRIFFSSAVNLRTSRVSLE